MKNTMQIVSITWIYCDFGMRRWKRAFNIDSQNQPVRLNSNVNGLRKKKTNKQTNTMETVDVNQLVNSMRYPSL